jgi:hypothetical protein
MRRGLWMVVKLNDVDTALLVEVLVVEVFCGQIDVPFFYLRQMIEVQIRKIFRKVTKTNTVAYN